MPTAGAILQGFAYGEHVEGTPPRSLGYRLLAPAALQPWAAEVEALARGLQGTPYPDPWATVELFCSVLLADGQRLVAVARYGLADHTASRRRGGLELIGVVGPADLGAAQALAVYRWLRQLRAGVEDVRTLATTYALADVLAAAPPGPAPEPAPVLPVRLWENGVLLFAATSPADPDNRLALLLQEAGRAWQWLPLCGADFPLQTYAGRGPLVAWTPHLAEVAVRLESRLAVVPPPRPAPVARTPLVVLTVLVVFLLGANLWALLTLPDRLAAGRPAPVAERPREKEPRPGPPPSVEAPEVSREKFALALRRLLGDGPGQGGDLTRSEKELIARYERLLKADGDLRVDSPKAQAAVGLLSVLTRWSPERVSQVIQNELSDPEVAKLIGERVRARLLAEGLRHP